MEHLIQEALKTLDRRNQLPKLPEGTRLPLPAINKVELYLSFYGNDHCSHCITNSGPHRKETMSPYNVPRILENISKYSVINRLKTVTGSGEFVFNLHDKCKKLDGLESMPEKMTRELIDEYADCLMGKGYTSNWINEDTSIDLNFGRPSVRISGGEFYTWPHELDGREVPEKQRLNYQKKLLDDIRKILPEYDIFILTNGRFAETSEKTKRVIEHWAGGSTAAGGRTRISISLDILHRPPQGSTVEKMLQRIWTACKKVSLGAPFLYGINNHWIALAGRAFETFGCCNKYKPQFQNVSGSSFNPQGEIKLDPVDLVYRGGCRELKGFVCETKFGTMLVNNIVIMPTGQLAYCCVCVGDFGNVLYEPEKALKNIMTDPVAMMLRQEQTAINLLNIAVELDPTIKVFGYGENAAVTGSTCYQFLSGKRVIK